MELHGSVLDWAASARFSTGPEKQHQRLSYRVDLTVFPPSPRRAYLPLKLTDSVDSSYGWVTRSLDRDTRKSKFISTLHWLQQPGDEQCYSITQHQVLAKQPIGLTTCQFSSSNLNTTMPSLDVLSEKYEEPYSESVDTEYEGDGGRFAAISTVSSGHGGRAPNAWKLMNEEDLFRVLSRNRTGIFGRTSTVATASSTEGELGEINKLISLIIVIKSVTMKGIGLGAALQPLVCDLFPTTFSLKTRVRLPESLPHVTLSHVTLRRGRIWDWLTFSHHVVTSDRSELLYDPEDNAALVERAREMIVSKLFRIEYTTNVKVGNELAHGIFDGEKKWASIAEAMVTKASARRPPWNTDALYQAGESLYDIYDKILRTDEGCYYFGPAEKAAVYYKSLGYVPLKSTNAISKIGGNRGPLGRLPKLSKLFLAANSIITIRNAVLREPRAPKKNFNLPFYNQGNILFPALIVGSPSNNRPKTTAGVFTRGIVIFFILLSNALLALAEPIAAFESHPILLKHRSLSFCRLAAYAIAQTVVDTPLSTSCRPYNLYLLSASFLSTFMAFDNDHVRLLSGNRSLVDSLDPATGITSMHKFISDFVFHIVVSSPYSNNSLIACSSHYLLELLDFIEKDATIVSWLRWINLVQFAFEAWWPTNPTTLNLILVTSFTLSNEAYLGRLRLVEPTISKTLDLSALFFVFFVSPTSFGIDLLKSNKDDDAVANYTCNKNVHTGQQLLNTAFNPMGSNQEWQDFHLAKRQLHHPIEEGKRKLFQDIQGYVKPGKLIAFMGASGAGKKTLLNTLPRRIQFGVVQDDFLVDGQSLPSSFQGPTSFVKQMDIYYVENIIDLLEIHNMTSAVIGRSSPPIDLIQELSSKSTRSCESLLSQLFDQLLLLKIDGASPKNEKLTKEIQGIIRVFMFHIFTSLFNPFAFWYLRNRHKRRRDPGYEVDLLIARRNLKDLLLECVLLRCYLERDTLRQSRWNNLLRGAAGTRPRGVHATLTLLQAFGSLRLCLSTFILDSVKAIAAFSPNEFRRFTLIPFSCSFLQCRGPVNRPPCLISGKVGCTGGGPSTSARRHVGPTYREIAVFAPPPGQDSVRRLRADPTKRQLWLFPTPEKNTVCSQL
ncbi:uncharacterized protein BDR25DRAFT_394762 [Lindgomyces ingoldianus]|uniref:Uncharacterized protein n=1 Tax=Lindgomyces ingoldianus TaxID=673940 RepID=A0ACB6QNK8_9PLEO|nr:uncharacterized protein BDR25DRAFT_394762 [Lindgomyces ingoldianus]KAF2468496.1 hypothetical protein BDR25DRAFT_394762 [Lindgomyces ingoldianus]